MQNLDEQLRRHYAERALSDRDADRILAATSSGHPKGRRRLWIGLAAAAAVLVVAVGLSLLLPSFDERLTARNCWNLAATHKLAIEVNCDWTGKQITLETVDEHSVRNRRITLQ